MKLATDAYAIGPGLHDWEREEWERQEIANDQREERFNADFRLWEMFAYCDRNKEADKKDIEEKMNHALDLLYDNEKESEKFRFLLFLAYCSNEHTDELRQIIGVYLMKSFKSQWVPDS